jgi:hypothetical protein
MLPSGDVHTAAGLVINARLNRPGNRQLVRRWIRGTPAANPDEDEPRSGLPARPTELRKLIQHRRYRIEPRRAALVLSLSELGWRPGSAHAASRSPQADVVPAAATTQIAIDGKPLEETLRCLTGEAIDITGPATLRADLRTHGRVPHLARNMTGTLQVDLAGGRINKFTLLGNILTISNLASVGKKHADGFPYRSALLRGRFDQGMLVVEEGGFVSDALNVAATGRIDLLGNNSRS